MINEPYRYSRVALLLGSVMMAANGCSTVGPFYQTPPSDPAPAPAVHQIGQRILLIGDAGAPFLKSGQRVEVHDRLARIAAEAPTRTAVVFLGDNIYPAGAYPVEDSLRYTSVLESQLEALRTGAKGIFLPGNHDWAKGNRGFGLEAIRRQGVLIGSYRPALDVRLLPDTIGGCPGPHAVDLSRVRLVTLDTQWWLHDPDARGSCGSEAAVLDSLGQLLSGAGEREVVVVGHHPLTTTGPHGQSRWWGFVTPQAHLDPTAWWARIPVQIVGGTIGWLLGGARGGLIGAGTITVAYPATRLLAHPDQDRWSARYNHFESRISGVLEKAPPLVYAAGHDHSLQVHRGAGKAEYEVVSGLGSDEKASPVSMNTRTLFALASPGFVSLDFFTDGRVLLRVHGPGGTIPYWHWLRAR